MPRTRTSRPRRPRALVLLTALIAAAALVVPTTGALAARPAPTPALPKIAVTAVTNITGLPKASGTPAVLIDAAELFDVKVTFVNGVYSTRDDTRVLITASKGGLLPAEVEVVVVVPARSSTGIAKDLRLAVANGVVLTATPVERTALRALGTGSSMAFDVVKDTALVPVPANRDPVVVTKTGVPCQPTPEVETCVDVLLPKGLDAPEGLNTANVFFSTGSCDGVGCSKPGLDVLQVLADLGSRYPKTAPATLVVKCDKSLCEGGGIKQYVLRASLDPTGPLSPVPACAVKGVIDPDVTPDDPTDTEIESCVDYVQSKRDGSGDTYLYWLVTRDARMSF